MWLYYHWDAGVDTLHTNTPCHSMSLHTNTWYWSINVQRVNSTGPSGCNQIETYSFTVINNECQINEWLLGGLETRLWDWVGVLLNDWQWVVLTSFRDVGDYGHRFASCLDHGIIRRMTLTSPGNFKSIFLLVKVISRTPCIPSTGNQIQLQRTHFPLTMAIAWPTGHTMFLRRWINVIDVDSTSYERRVHSAVTLRCANILHCIWITEKI